MVNICWGDLETTGLDANKNIPLELGLRITDEYGRPAFDGNNEFTTLIHEGSLDWKIELGFGAAHEIVGPMHAKSGLWDDLQEARGTSAALTRAEADECAVEWLQSKGVEPVTLPLYGNSIGSLDRPFLLVHFPKLNEFLHYRNVDISTVKELCRVHNPELFAKMPKERSTAEAPHRVQEDITESINEYLFYVDNFLWTADD